MKRVLNFMQSWGFILLGIILIVCGLIYGALPERMPYQSITKAFLAHYLSGRGIGYMQLERSSVLYTVNEGDYLPAFSADYLNHGNVLISFLYRADQTTSIDASSANNIHLIGPAFSIVRITLYHHYGQQPVEFSSLEYRQNPNGYYIQNWTVGIWSSILGIIFIGSGYIKKAVQGKKRNQLDFTNSTVPIFVEQNKKPEKLIQS